MNDMRVQIEARYPPEGTEQKTAWFTLPVSEDELMDELGIDADSEDYIVKDTDLPYDFIPLGEYMTLDEMNDIYDMYENLQSEVQAEIDAIMEEHDSLDELFEHRHDIIHYPSCHNMADVAREFLTETGALYEIPEYLHEHIDYESYGESLAEDNRWVITGHGVFELPYY